MRRVAMSPGEEALVAHWHEVLSKSWKFEFERDGRIDLRWPYAGREMRGMTIKGDLVFRESKVVVEVDGYKWHSSYEAFCKDRERDLALRQCGWDCIRFTSEMATKDPSECWTIILVTVFKRLSEKERLRGDG